MSKKKYAIPFLCIVLLVAASLACGKGSEPTKAPADVEPTKTAATEAPAEDPVDNPTDVPEVEPTEEPAKEEPAEAPAEIDVPFPLPDDAQNVTEMGGGVVNFQTDLSLEEVADFYLQEIPDMGYTEREVTTVISEDVVNLVFDDPEGGESIVVQAIPLDGATNVGIRYEDV
jgi:hypothetical protein